MKLFKLLDAGGASPCFGYQWPLPEREGEPGEWTPKIMRVGVFERGYHLVSLEELLDTDGCDLWLAEGRGRRECDGGIVAFEQARLLRRIEFTAGMLKSYAVWCARTALDELSLCVPKIEMLLEYCGEHQSDRLHLEQLAEAVKDDYIAFASFDQWRAYKCMSEQYRLRSYVTEHIYLLGTVLSEVAEMAELDRPPDAREKMVCRHIHHYAVAVMVGARLSAAFPEGNISDAMRAERDRIEPCFLAELGKRLGVKRRRDGWEVSRT